MPTALHTRPGAAYDQIDHLLHEDRAHVCRYVRRVVGVPERVADAGVMRTGEVRLAGTASVVLMQPTTLCNLNCSYCYLPDRKVSRRMSVDVAEAVAAGVREWSKRRPVVVVWHGGEPLAVGPAYFRSLVVPFGPVRCIRWFMLYRPTPRLSTRPGVRCSRRHPSGSR
ncbi:radical SAM protein [Actinoallomurus liliacearum]|uniref:radical SAM protein n=1 Tax=Actinoallomurus liliacearum TaxID=1080073 RepID=UPI003CD06D96